MGTKQEKMLVNYLAAAILACGGELKLSDYLVFVADKNDVQVVVEQDAYTQAHVLKVYHGKERFVAQEVDDSYEKLLLNNGEGQS